MDVEGNLKLLRMEAYRLSELSLASDASAADKADQRANAFSGMALAGAALLTGLFDQSHPQVGMLVAALMLIVAAGLAAYSARPQKFYFPGARFDDFDADFQNGTQVELALVQLAGFNDKHSRHNRNLLERNSRILRLAYIFAIAGVGVSILSQLYTYWKP